MIMHLDQLLEHFWKPQSLSCCLCMDGVRRYRRRQSLIGADEEDEETVSSTKSALVIEESAKQAESLQKEGYRSLPPPNTTCPYNSKAFFTSKWAKYGCRLTYFSILKKQREKAFFKLCWIDSVSGAAAMASWQWA